MKPYPHFCVVGHPNQGKSSIVSTLVENAHIRIGVESGTTQKAERFEFIIQNQVLLALTDTPGFQRARQVLAWLNEIPVTPAQRPERIQAFLNEPSHAQLFPDEVELLTPIMQGAGILYITDAASDLTAADEAEMEILRWTGQPRMAIINPIDPDHQDPNWQVTLNQFFQWVRVFNPMTATLPTRIALLNAMAELSQGWTQAIKLLNQRLIERDQERIEQVSLQLAEYWCEQISRRLAITPLNSVLPTPPEELFQQQLDQSETHFFEQLLTQWGHAQAHTEKERLWQAQDSSLMNTEHWYLWGLKQKELLMISGAAGMATGAVIDLGSGGTSLMLGAVSGAIIGASSGWLASQHLPKKVFGWLPLSKEKHFVGPITHPNFPLVVMARALTFTQRVWFKSHAERRQLDLKSQASDWSKADQIQLLQWAKALQKQQWKDKHQHQLTQWIKDSLHETLTAKLAQEQAKVWKLDPKK